MIYAPRNEPSETSGPCKSEEEFISYHLKGENPRLLFRRGDIVGGHTIDLIDLFPLIIPFGWGEPNEKSTTKRVLCYNITAEYLYHRCSKHNFNSSL